MNAAEWRERLTGRDPFDALMGTRVPEWVRRGERSRQLATQVRKRLPVEIGPLLGVEPFLMAKTAVTFLTAEARRAASPERDADLDALAGICLGAGGHVGAGEWGYEFDVQTRWAYYPARTPNLIVTWFAARGFAEAGAATRRDAWVDELHSAAAFVRSRLVTDPPGRFVRYVPGSPRLVHNASLLGAALLAASGRMVGDAAGVETALEVTRTSLAQQREDGSFPYGEGPGLAWEDSFHTAYDLDALMMVWLATGDDSVRSALDRGVEHWAGRFFGRDGEPWFGPGRRYPLDVHSAGTAMDVGARLASWGLADPELPRRVAEWTREHLVDPRTGGTYARVLRTGTDRRHFVRWGDAHVALGTRSLEMLAESRRSPLEAEIARRMPS